MDQVLEDQIRDQGEDEDREGGNSGVGEKPGVYAVLEGKFEKVFREEGMISVSNSADRSIRMTENGISVTLMFHITKNMEIRVK